MKADEWWQFLLFMAGMGLVQWMLFKLLLMDFGQGRKKDANRQGDVAPGDPGQVPLDPGADDLHGESADGGTGGEGGHQ